MISREPEGFFIKLTIGNPKAVDLYTPAREIITGTRDGIPFMRVITWAQKFKNVADFPLSAPEAASIIAVLEELRSANLTPTSSQTSFGLYARLGYYGFAQNPKSALVLPYLKTAAQIQGIAINLAMQRMR